MLGGLADRQQQRVGHCPAAPLPAPGAAFCVTRSTKPYPHWPRYLDWTVKEVRYTKEKRNKKGEITQEVRPGPGRPHWP